jgi:hypothetical protein
MKRTIKMKAHDGNGTRVEVKFDISRNGLTIGEMETLVAQIKDELMATLPPLRFSHFNLSDARFK